MKHAGLIRWNVIDRHTNGRIVGGYTTERGAVNAAAKMNADWSCKGRFVAKAR